MCEFRKLRADEIECRVGSETKDKSAFTLLLYKDARCDMKILDETVGSLNWQKKYSRDNANCVVSIWDEKKNQWIEKEDTGTESDTESAKGLASDSFKRACFAWGIGRELYTAPTIWIRDYDKHCRFTVTEIGYDEFGNINRLEIIENKSGDTVYSMGGYRTPAKAKATELISPQQKADILREVNRTKCSLEDICNRYKVDTIDDLPASRFEKVMSILSNMESV